ncbi:DUF4040 family protein [Corynebacterium lowii]|uniref:Na(+)/H(+) antiporter subunit A n=1 Tax=Corynebacterium lowii TaxID=1544413 RepID=A0A0Q1AJY8_9CORY|nr:DUF4040 family protein [Corynebacterium lowii]KQB87206.1 Na(+)/H(+) antiporter subunit A [Corynebacterium lowii]MDP9852207.1 multicomponent Na+:H+ antiporter subunit A [Corynebacterium lowii]
MTLAIVIALAVGAVILAPPLVSVADRGAGWGLAALFLTAAAALGINLPGIFDGEPLTWSVVWARDFLAPGVDVTFALRADALSAFFALLALCIGAVVFIYSAAYLPKKQGNTSFYTIMTAFTLAVLLLVLADDVVVLFIGWELVSIASFLLIARSGSSGEAGAQRTLLLTFIGGLTLLAAIVVAATRTGTTSVQGILDSSVWADNPGLTSTVAVLVAASAFTKAAQLPFHFWLPEAMAAATPVSAFLHAAAVVKAGVYLLMRFSAIFHDVAVWNWLLIGVGLTTAVVSALFAVQKTDLKKLTAYSTVSHLGWIVATIGVGTPLALSAALVHTLAHALFKSSIFMLIGVVDHEAGTRDTRRLGVLWRSMPFTCTGMVVGALSMAAIPPTFGFISKEGMLGALYEVEGYGTLLLAVAGIGALLTFTYSAKLVFGAFFDPATEHPTRHMEGVHEAPVALWLPAALPGLLSLPLGLVPMFLNHPMDSIVAAIGLSEVAGSGAAADSAETTAISEAVEAHTHLALWHGINAPFIVSILVIALGILGVTQRHRIWPALESRFFLPFNGNGLLAALQQGATRLGHFFGHMANSQSPSRHLVWPVLSVIALMLFTLLGSTGIDGTPLAPRAEGLDNWLDLAPFLIILLSVVGLMRSTHRLTSAVLAGTVGVGITFQMLILGAPDVALTQFLVEALVVVIIMMVLRYQPARFPRSDRKRTIRSLVIALLAGLAAFLGVFTLMGRNDRSDLAEWYITNAPEITGGKNIVATIIVEFRALDTLGELSVLGMAAIVIGSVAASFPRHPFAKGTRPAPFGQSQLNSLPLRAALRLVAPLLAVLSVVVFMRGHMDPGGGFVAALIAGTGIMLFYLSRGRDSIVAHPSTPYWLTGIGIVTALAAGLVGLVEGSFLAPLHAEILGQHLSTSLIFDGGIYLAVLGMLMAAVNYLGNYEKPGTATTQELPFARTEEGPLAPTPGVGASGGEAHAVGASAASGTTEAAQAQDVEPQADATRTRAQAPAHAAGTRENAATRTQEEAR